MLTIFLDNIFIKIQETLEGLKSSESAKRALIFNNKKLLWENTLYQSDENSTKDPRIDLNLARTRMQFSEKKWVLLNKESGEHKYDGLYSNHEIFQMLYAKKILLTDPIWKEGQSKWLPIKQTETFKGLLGPIEPDIADILSHVVEYVPRMRRVEDKNSSPDDPDKVFIILDDK